MVRGKNPAADYGLAIPVALPHPLGLQLCNRDNRFLWRPISQASTKYSTCYCLPRPLPARPCRHLPAERRVGIPGLIRRLVSS